MIRILPIFLFVFLAEAFPQQGRIRSLYEVNDTVDFGICHSSRTIDRHFIIERTGSSDLRIDEGAPTAILRKSPGDIIDGQQFRFFLDPSTQYPKALHSGKPVDSVLVTFFGKIDIPRPNGKKEAEFILRLVTDDKDRDSVFEKKYILIARNTDKYIGSYESPMDFDSVMTDTEIPYTRKWFIKNVWDSRLKCHGSFFRLLSSKVTEDEFSIKEPPMPVELAPEDEPYPIEITYKPLDLTRDKAEYGLIFYPHQNEGDFQTLDTAYVELNATGVKPGIEVAAVLTDQAFSFDPNEALFEIETGQVKVGQKITVRAILNNKGNIPLHVTDNTFEQSRNDDVEFINKAGGAAHWKLQQNDTLEFTFTPKSNGLFNSYIVLECDYSGRKIYGVQSRHKKLKIKLSGSAVQPKMVLSTEELAMGQLSSSPGCENSLGREIEIINNGNDPLEIFSIELEDEENFDYALDKDILKFQEKAILSVTFIPQATGDYQTRLRIVSNQPAPFDTIYVTVTGTSLPPIDARLMINDLKAAPGRTINVPLILKGGLARFATAYRDLIKYDRTLLEFDGWTSAGTASEGNAPEADVAFDSTEAALRVNITRQNGRNFLERDTLVILRFKTYLGDHAFTHVEFNDPVISDGNCDNLFSIDRKPGLFELDSVCGLDYKTYKAAQGLFQLKGITPNPAYEEIEVIFENAVRVRTEIAVFDCFGTMVKRILESEMPAGAQSVRAPITELTNGVYYLRYRAGIRTETLQFTKLK